MATITYYYQFQDEKPQQVSGEVIFTHYMKENTNVTNISAESNRMTIYFGTQIHQFLVIEPGPPMTITFRHIIGRMR